MSFPGGTPPPAGVLVINNCPACQCQTCPAIDVGSHLGRTVSIWIGCVLAVVLITYIVASWIRRRRPAAVIVLPPLPPPRSPPVTVTPLRETTAPLFYVPLKQPYPYPCFVTVVNDRDELDAATTCCAIM